MVLGELQTAWLPAGDQEIRDLRVGLVVIRLKLQCAVELRIGVLPVLQLEVGFGQLIVSGRELRIHFNGVAILNDGFTVLAFCEVSLATLVIFLFAYVRVARTTGQKGGQTSDHHDQTKRNMLHYRLSWRNSTPLNSDFVGGSNVTPAKPCPKVTRVTFGRKARDRRAFSPWDIGVDPRDDVAGERNQDLLR